MNVRAGRSSARPALLASSGRRAFLGLLGAGAAATVVGEADRAVAGAAPGRRLVPRTLAASSTAGVASPGFPVEYVAVRWPAGIDGGRIRFADRAGHLGRWQRIRAGCVGGRGDGETEGVRGALVRACGALRYEVDLPSGASAVALNGADGPLTVAVAQPKAASFADCSYLSRAAWGADESLRFDDSGAERFPQTYWPVQTLTVHHTATANDDPDPAARMRAIYRNQAVELGFGDFGYHFLIDEAGRVYEGRWSGEDGIPGFDRTGQMVNAAHVGGFNAGNVGVVLLGNFVDRAPAVAAVRSLTLVLAAIAGWVGLDPLGIVDYVNPISGAMRTVPAIPGHRDWAATECPGAVLAGLLPTIRENVAGLLRSGAAPALVVRS
jgi:hypothetical protein